MEAKNYRIMDDREIQEAVRGIISDSLNPKEIRHRLKEDLGYSSVSAIDFQYEAGRRHHGAVSKDGARVVLMLYGPRGNAIFL